MTRGISTHVYNSHFDPVVLRELGDDRVGRRLKGRQLLAGIGIEDVKPLGPGQLAGVDQVDEQGEGGGAVLTARPGNRDMAMKRPIGAERLKGQLHRLLVNHPDATGEEIVDRAGHR
ncbi:MAG: hypothetical protein ACXWUO_09000 [Allosphingosinicella sp.]